MMKNLVEYEEDSESDEVWKKNAIQPIKMSADKGKQIVSEDNEEDCASAILPWQDFSPEASSSSTPSSSIKNWFVDMGCSSTIVDKAISIYGTDNEDDILEYILACQASSFSNTPSNSVKSWFVDMGCSPTIIDKAISIYGTNNEDDILEYVLACQIADSSSDSSNQDSISDLERLESDDHYNFEENEVKSKDWFYGYLDLKEGQSEEFLSDYIRAQLMEMGFSENEISAAIGINGVDTPIQELVDFIYAYMHGTKGDKEGGDVVLEKCKIKRQKKQDGDPFRSKFRKGKQTDSIPSGLKSGLDLKFGSDSCSSSVLNRLMGFGVPGYPARGRSRELKPFMKGPIFFYFENVAIAPKDVWKTISRHFDGAEPEFVDSKYFSASRRPRGYVHNLPLDERFQLLPLPPMTIHETFPQTKRYWPSWDHREKLNCICGGRASDVLCQELRSIIKRSQGKPSLSEQAYILDLCKKHNLLWVGPDQMAPLEPHEIELVLGYEKDHTRGVPLTERLQCLANSFQIDTVAYHFSVLKPYYPNGIKVLSLFSGIGGAEVALHRLGIHLRCVVSVEINPKPRLILNNWWKRTQQTGRLIEKEDVQELTRGVLEQLIDTVGGFDIIIGGSPCNNLSGKNRVSRDGLEGRQSSVFYEFPRILNEVRQIMSSKGMI